MKRNYTKHLLWIVPLVILLLAGIWMVGTYNSLINAEVAVDTQYAQVQTTYQRRADLIPNLVNTVQGAVDFEQETQTQIAALRSQAQQVRQQIQAADTPQELQAAGERLDQVVTAYRGLNINVENYPQLRATENFLSLQDELAGTENRIAVARQRYNDVVGEYNRMVRTFPRNVVAGMFGFDQKEFFEAQPDAQDAPTVTFE